MIELHHVYLVVGLRVDDVRAALLTTASDDSVRIMNIIGMYVSKTMLNKVEQQC